MSDTPYPKPEIWRFENRHIGITESDINEMLKHIPCDSLEQLIKETVPEDIYRDQHLDIADAVSEEQAIAELRSIATENRVCKSYIGMGYYDTHTPSIIQRNILENPGWYTAYTPYQAEISQGRMEMLLNYQQMVCDLTGMALANASMLDEGTAAAEAMAMAHRQSKKKGCDQFFVDQDIHPQTLAVLKTRAEFFGFELAIGNPNDALPDCFGALFHYPGSSGHIGDLERYIAATHAQGGLAVVASDLLALTLLKPPGEMDADIVFGSSQRFGVPMGFGGPHAAFFAFKEKFKRSAPGRIIGVSVDSRGNRAFRMAMQTREQHIRREKATSNICTSQVLLAIIAAAYAVYQGAEGILAIAQNVHHKTSRLAIGLKKAEYPLLNTCWFDTLSLDFSEHPQKRAEIIERALAANINLRIDEHRLGISLDETTTEEDLSQIAALFDIVLPQNVPVGESGIHPEQTRTSAFLSHPVFKLHRTETEMLRYLHRLERKDLALNQSMIPLGSCTMKLNATSEMMPISWPEFAKLHPFAPLDQARGYIKMFHQLERMLSACTGYDAMSLQPNAGSQGEYAGLLAIARYHQQRGDTARTICLIPSSAHGTNPASAQMAGMKIVVIACDDQGNIDVDDLKTKVDQHRQSLAAIMITYPSTHGVFETRVRDVCNIVHEAGGQVYIDGANLNAMVGLADPGEFGGDVSHLNLHKTFCIPHGGGGPGMGPIGVRAHLQPFLPDHPLHSPNNAKSDITVSAAPWGSASILPISWMYIRMMGAQGLRQASVIAIFNANYIARRLQSEYPILYRGDQGHVAHECIIDIRPIKIESGIGEEDIAKRLIDYGFHAPTMSFPVAGTLMIEPTESESKAELDRFCDAMLAIRNEIHRVARGEWPLENNPLVNAPHTLNDILDEEWDRPYSRARATRPLRSQADHKYWPAVNRVDNVFGDRNLICSCPPIESYMDSVEPSPALTDASS